MKPILFLGILALAVSGCFGKKTGTPKTKCHQFNRSLYDPPPSIDLDCNSLFAMYIRKENLGRTHSVQKFGCVPDSGIWYDPLSGDTIFCSQKSRIDAIVSLPEAHRSGAWGWSPEKKRLFSNDTFNLILTREEMANMKRSTSPYPAMWLPTNIKIIRKYCRKYYEIKKKYHLSMDEEEAAIVNNWANLDTLDIRIESPALINCE
jgi:hypothetical protein